MRGYSGGMSRRMLTLVLLVAAARKVKRCIMGRK